MSGGGTQTSTTVQNSEIPAWMSKAGEDNYKKALELDAAPLQQYSGSTVAPLADTTKSAFEYFKNNSGQGLADTNTASGIFSSIKDLDTGYNTINPTSVNAGADIVAGQLKDTDLGQYMNPFIDNVENKAMESLDRSRLTSLMGNADKAVKSKAFGGSRSAIVDAVTNAESAREAGILSAGLRADAYKSAVEGATGDINRNLSTATGNRNTNIAVASDNANRALTADQLNQAARAGSQDAAFRNQNTAAAGLLSTGGAKHQQILDTFSGLSGIGALEQAQKQSEINADVNKFNEGRDKEYNDLQTRLAALGVTPSSTSSTSTQTTPKPGTDWATTGLGVFSLLMGLSDDDSKTDKEKLGTDPDSGLDIWAYRYKGDPKTYPKVVGPMASDVEKKKPHAMGPKIGGKRTVNYGILAAGL